MHHHGRTSSLFFMKVADLKILKTAFEIIMLNFSDWVLIKFNLAAVVLL